MKVQTVRIGLRAWGVKLLWLLLTGAMYTLQWGGLMNGKASPRRLCGVSRGNRSAK